MNKRFLLIFSVCLLSLTMQAQQYTEVLKSLELPVYKFNQKPGAAEKVTKSTIHPDMSSSETRLPINKIFNKVTLYYDELNELNIVIYDIISQTILQSNKKKLLNAFKKISGPETIKTDESGMYHVFVSEANEITLYEPNEKYKILKPYLKVKLVNNVKLIEKYDESAKATCLSPINFEEWVNQDELKYGISFIGYKESKKIIIRIISQSNDLKQFDKLQLRTDNGEVFAANLTTSQSTLERGALGPITQETGTAELPKEWVRKILASKSTKVKIQGKKTGEVMLTSDILNALRAVSDKVTK